jgi:siroheme decarboxylase
VILTDLHKRLLNDFQCDFPLLERPYQAIADQLGVSEEHVLSALTELSEQRYISRVGPIIRPNHLGISSLVAMAIPAEQLEQVAEIVSSYSEVNHNYERENRFNLWFVVIAAHEAHLVSILQEIELRTGLTTMRLPLLDDYFINLGFELELND